MGLTRPVPDGMVLVVVRHTDEGGEELHVIPSLDHASNDDFASGRMLREGEKMTFHVASHDGTVTAVEIQNSGGEGRIAPRK